MSGFDAATIYSASVFDHEAASSSATATESIFASFIYEFQIDRSFLYREQLRANCLIGQPRLHVNLAHLISFNEEIAHRLSAEPTELLPLVRRILEISTSLLMNKV